MQDEVELTIIIPAYKSEAFIKQVCEDRLAVLNSLGVPYELIVVIDGKSEETVNALNSIKSTNLNVVHYENNQGKGFAVKYGMERARGNYIGYVDSGPDIPSEIIKTMYEAGKETGVDAIIPSKWHEDSKVIYNGSRSLISKAYNLYTRTLLPLPVKDTQVGAKLYTKKLVKSVIPRLLVKRFAFEAEFLSVAYHLGFINFQEVPININADKQSTIKFIDGLHSLWDTMAVFYRMNLRHYYDHDLDYYQTKWKKILNTPKIVL